MPENVLFYNPYPLSYYGSQKLLHSIVKNLNKTKYIPIVLCPSEGIFVKELNKTGVDVRILPPSSYLTKYGGELLRPGFFKKILAFIAIIQYSFKLMSFIRGRDIKIIHCISSRAVLMVGLAAKLSRIPLIWHAMGEAPNKFLTWISGIISDKVIFVSKGMIKNFPGVRSSSKKISVIYNSIEMPDKKYNKYIKSRHNYKICCISVIHPRKGIEYLINAMSKVVNELSNIHLYIIGDSPSTLGEEYYNKLRKLTIDLGLSDIIEFCGWKEDVYDDLSDCDIFVLPSISEPFGLVLLEAMAMGIPVVATRVGGIPEVVDDRVTGILVPPKDPESMANAIITILTDKKMASNLGSRGRERFLDFFTINRMIKQIEEEYKNLVIEKNFFE